MVDQVVEVTFLCQRRQDVLKAVPRACLLHLWGVSGLNPWFISALLCSLFRTILVVMGQWGVVRDMQTFVILHIADSCVLTGGHKARIFY